MKYKFAKKRLDLNIRNENIFRYILDTATLKRESASNFIADFFHIIGMILYWRPKETKTIKSLVTKAMMKWKD